MPGLRRCFTVVDKSTGWCEYFKNATGFDHIVLMVGNIVIKVGNTFIKVGHIVIMVAHFARAV